MLDISINDIIIAPPVGNHSQSQAWIEEEDWDNGLATHSL